MLRQVQHRLQHLGWAVCCGLRHWNLQPLSPHDNTIHTCASALQRKMLEDTVRQEQEFQAMYQDVVDGLPNSRYDTQQCPCLAPAPSPASR